MTSKKINWAESEIKEIPNKIGVYWLSNERNEIIFVSSDHDIRKSALLLFEKLKKSKTNSIKVLEYETFNNFKEAIDCKLVLDDKISITLGTFDRRMMDVENLIEKGDLHHIALVITITALETFLREKFEEVWAINWFKSVRQNDETFKEKILHVCKTMKLEREFLNLVFIKNPENQIEILKIIKDLTFPPNKKSTINFQRLKGDLSAKWAYKQFLNIDIENELNSEDKLNWNKLVDYMDLRHEIIHGSKKPVDTAIKKTDVQEALELINQLTKRINELTISEYDKW